MKVNFLVDLVKVGEISGIQNAALRLAESLKQRGIEVDIGGKGYDYDIIHTHTPNPKFLSYFKKAREFGRAKIITHAHTTVEDTAGSFTFSDFFLTKIALGRYLNRFYNSADLVLTPSDWSKECLEKNGVKKPIEVLSNGINLSKFAFDRKKRDEFRKEYGVKANETLVYNVGLVFLRKGLKDFKQVARDMPDIKFFWIGKMQPRMMIKPIRMTMAMMNLPENLKMTGYVKDIMAAHSGGDIFFFPSYAENQGIVILEAAAMNRPIILRDIPVYRQWFKHNDNCYFGKTPKDFERGIRKIVADKDYRGKLVSNGYKVAKANDIEKSIDKLVSVYESVLD